MSRYFFYIRYLPEIVNCEFLAGKCIRILHAYQTKFKLRNIGVTFPEWEQDSIGRTIAFVSKSQGVLVILSQQNYFVRMAEEGYFQVGAVQLVPDGQEHCEFIYYRERRLEKATPSAKRRMLKRLQLRAAKAGVEYVHKPEVSECIEVPFVHQLPSGSSSGADFLLFVGRMECEQQKPADFNSYGLGNRPEQQGSVPCLRPIIFDEK
ncbi:type I-F CRISPR-associated endoribonuclease Cas6/Csy4 [Rheinheimera texasensis]|uniref:type I-F CRISPR-associated endoribonuclease Cas6/Csy4 n=1 Tax=Rheinheimera texasensis TaxID=306205 RepID=UPI0032B0F0E8